MKGLNNMGFDIGDVVQVKKHLIGVLVGAIGIIREKTNRYGYLVEFPKSVIDNPVYSFNGVKINAFRIEGKNLELLDYTTDEEEKFLTEIRNQRADEKCNTWEVRIRPSMDDKDTTYAELYINGRYEDAEYVSRYYADEYNASTACVEVCKKLFGIKEAENIEKNEETPMPKYYTGKVVCISGNKFFTKGKVYEVEDGNVIDDEGSIYSFLEGIYDMCAQLNAEFIEFVE